MLELGTMWSSLARLTNIARVEYDVVSPGKSNIVIVWYNVVFPGKSNMLELGKCGLPWQE